MALNAQCNLIFQNYDHKHLRLLFNNIQWTIKISVVLWTSWVRWGRNMMAQGDSEVTMAELAQTQLQLAPGCKSKGSALISKDPFSGQQEPFDLCFMGFHRVDYVDVNRKDTPAVLRGSRLFQQISLKPCFSTSGSFERPEHQYFLKLPS